MPKKKAKRKTKSDAIDHGEVTVDSPLISLVRMLEWKRDCTGADQQDQQDHIHGLLLRSKAAIEAVQRACEAAGLLGPGNPLTVDAATKLEQSMPPTRIGDLAGQATETVHPDGESGDTSSPTNKRPGRKSGEQATVNQQMRAIVETNHESHAWTLQQWADHLGCAKSTAWNTGTWRSLDKLRAATRAEQLIKKAEKALRLSKVVTLPEGGDVVDFWEIRSEAGATDQEISAEIKSLIKNAESVDLTNVHYREGSANAKEVVYVSADEPGMIDGAVKALADSKSIYQRGGNLVHVVNDAMPPKFMRQSGAPRIKGIQKARLREELSALRDWQKSTEESMVSVRPPDWMIDGVLARDQWSTVRPLTGIAETPVLRPDGSILQEEGYDSETGLLAHFGSTLFPEISSRPTIDDARRSLDVLMEPIADFPFASDSHLSAMVAAIFIPLAWHAIQEPAPLHAIDGNRRGCGKSMLADIVSVLATGRDMPRMSEPQDREEAEKRITAIALAGEPLVLVDNVAGRLGWPALDAALTGGTWSGRILGKSEMVLVPLVTTWFATGNNIIIGGDLGRRCLPIRLETPEEKPEERTGFRHPRLIRWVHDNRATLVGAALTVLRPIVTPDVHR